jgi:hypothetical protein
VQSKRRQWRAEEQVLPRLQSEGPVIAKRVLEDMQREKARGTKEELQTIHRTRMKDAVWSYRAVSWERTELVSSGRSSQERTVCRVSLSTYDDDGRTAPHSVARFRWVLCRACTHIAAPHTFGLRVVPYSLHARPSRPDCGLTDRTWFHYIGKRGKFQVVHDGPTT